LIWLIAFILTADSGIDFNEIDFKKLQTTPLKSNRELSAGGQNTMTATAAKPSSTRITFSVYDSLNL